MSRDEMTLEELRRAFTAEPVGRPARSDCPDAETLWGGARGELSAGRVSELLRHLRRCAACSSEWSAAVASPGETGRSGKTARDRSAVRGWRRLRRPVLALAALLIVAVAVVALVERGGPSQTETAFRAGDAKFIHPLVPDGSALPPDGFLLRWDPVEEEARYRVMVRHRDLRPFAEARDLVEPEYLVPRALLENLPSGTPFVWRVEAHLIDGRRLVSEAFLVELE